MGDFTRVKSPMKIHGRFYLSKKTPDYKMTHQLYFYIAFEELTFYHKCSIKCVLYCLFTLMLIDQKGEKVWCEQVWPQEVSRLTLIILIDRLTYFTFNIFHVIRYKFTLMLIDRKEERKCEVKWASAKNSHWFVIFFSSK